MVGGLTKELSVCGRCLVVVAVVAVERREDRGEDSGATAVFGLRKKGRLWGWSPESVGGSVDGWFSVG